MQLASSQPSLFIGSNESHHRCKYNYELFLAYFHIFYLCFVFNVLTFVVYFYAFVFLVLLDFLLDSTLVVCCFSCLFLKMYEHHDCYFSWVHQEGTDRGTP